jgi:peroxiredoxin
VVVGISADSLASHLRFAEKLGGLPFPLLSDSQRETIGAYGVLNDKGSGARRSVFVVDRTGILRYQNVKYEVSKEAHFEALLEALEALREN